MAGKRPPKQGKPRNAKSKQSKRAVRRFTQEENVGYLRSLGINLSKGIQSSKQYVSKLASRFRRAERGGQSITRREAAGHGAGEYHRGRAWHVAPRYRLRKDGTRYLFVPEQWGGGPVVKKRESTARIAGPDDVLQALHHWRGKTTHVRVAILGYWIYTLGGEGEWGWKALVVPYSQLEKLLNGVRKDLEEYEEAQVAALEGNPTDAERKQIAASVRAEEQRLMAELVTVDLFDGEPAVEKPFAWSIAKSGG